MGGKNVCGVAVAAFLAAAACGAGLAMAGPGQANTRDGCTGQDCRVRTVTPACRAFASFEACSSARVGRVACDGDAGVLRMCARDGGWDAIGSGGGGSSSSEWVRAGGAVVTDAGVRAVFRSGVTNAGLELWEAGNLRAALHLHSPGNNPRLITSTGAVDVRNSVGFYAGVFASVVEAQASSGNTALRVNTGARAVLNGATQTVYVDSDGTNVRTGAPLLIGTSNSAAISRSPRTTLVHDGGTVAAHSIYSQTVTLPGATAGAECAAGYTFQPPGMVITCQCDDANTATAHFINVTAGGLTPGTGPVALRCFNP